MSIFIDVADHIIFEDPYILVIDKPGSLMVEPDRNGHPNLLQQVRKYLKASATDGSEVYAQHLHRLDRPVSGIVLFAKRREVLKNLSEQFAERKIKKFYQALTTQAPEHFKGTLEHWHRKEKKKAIITKEHHQDSEKVMLHYEAKPFSSDLFLWNIELHTGKYHQIRAQLSSIGCPIVGDAFYGSTTLYKKDSIALSAVKLIFCHPVSQMEMVMEKTFFP